MNNTKIFYVWKENGFDPFSSNIDWKGDSLENWYIYVSFDKTVTKTMYFDLHEVKNFISKTYKFSRRDRPRPQIITAAPNNFNSIEGKLNLEYEMPMIINDLNFDGLLNKDILFVRSVQDKDFEKGENLYIDIAYKKIITKENRDFRRHRNYLSTMRQIKLTEYINKYPGFEFEASIINYFTYNLNPACNRTFEQLYNDHETEQLAFGYESYLDELNNF